MEQDYLTNIEDIPDKIFRKRQKRGRKEKKVEVILTGMEKLEREEKEIYIKLKEYLHSIDNLHTRLQDIKIIRSKF
jgi:cysteinyl-tRNA synthetase